MNDSPSQNVSDQGRRSRRRRAVLVGLLVAGLCASAAVVGCFAFGLFKAVYFPDKAFYAPAVVVQTNYPGANAQVVADTVAVPIEQQVYGVEDMVQMTSQCTNNGDYSLTVTFKPGTDLNLAQVLVQNRVNLALPQLPDAVKLGGIKTLKKAVGVLMYVVVMDDGRHDEQYLSKVANTLVVDELARTPGVAEVAPLGPRDFGVRIEPDPEKLAARDLTMCDVIKAVEQDKAELEAAGHKLQDESGIQEQLANLILKADQQGRRVYLRDVAALDIGGLDRWRYARFNGQNGPIFAVSRLPQTKPREVAAALRDNLAALQARLPEGVHLEVADRLASDHLRLDISLPDSASTERTQAVLQKCEKMVKEADGVQDVLSLSGPSIDLPENHGCVLVHFAAGEQGLSGNRAQRLRDRLSAEIQDAVVRVCEQPVGGLPPGGYPVQFAVCDTGDTGMQALTALTQRITERLAASGKLRDVWADPRSGGVPTLAVDIDRAKANALGLAVADINQTVQACFDGVVITEVNVRGRPMQVIVPVPTAGASRPEKLKEQMVRGADGKLIPLGTVAEVREISAPACVRRLNMYPMVRITANLKAGATEAEARSLCKTAFAQEATGPLYRLEWLRELPAR
jgi:multidrug efflux pump subunit AcrB